MRIALCGEARSGKDTVADILKCLYLDSTNDIMDRLAFGDFMKEKYYEANPHKVSMPKDREHMIEWSQPQVEKDNLIWVRELEGSMEDIIMYDGVYSFVITDLRQPHEEKWCRENGFHIVRVHAPSIMRERRMRDLGEGVTLKDLKYWVDADFHIYNDGSLEELQKKLQKTLASIRSI
ncbi:hypothetical protein BC7_00061 [Bacillus phage BC-7]|nr:hypothetical protein BC7_00061 [Bacillus phage BC-7]